jgi:hypothetical protein
MWIGPGGQINLCTGHVKKALRVSVRQSARFFDIDDVVRNGSDA